MTKETKALAPFEVKATDNETRTFEGYASTWDLDLGGDVIHKGAFANTLKEWRKTGRVIPLIDQHTYRSVRDVLGKLVDAREDDEGLWTKWKVTEGQDGDELLHRLRAGIITGLSIGFQIVKSEWEEDRESDAPVVRHIKEVDLMEVSAVIWGMNPEALIATSTVKSLLDDVDPDALSEEERKELRRLASRIGNILQRSSAAATPPEEKDDDDATPPEVTPAPAADSRTADEDPGEPLYGFDEALRQRIAGYKLQRTISNAR